MSVVNGNGGLPLGVSEGLSHIVQVKALVQCLACNWELLLFTGKNGESGGSQKKKKERKKKEFKKVGEILCL